MISTVTAAIRLKVRRGSEPWIAQAAKARTAMPMTSGTNQPET
ncbi:hypothetical protein [Falsiroseomonas sp. HW251]